MKFGMESKVITLPVTLQQGTATLQGVLENGLLNGPLHIQDDQLPLAQLNYTSGQLHGLSLLQHPNGQISARLPYVEGKLHGNAEYFAEDGCLLRRESWQDGQRHGESRTLFADGSPQEIAPYRQGLLHGQRERFHPNGQLAEQQAFSHGQPLAPTQVYAADGRALDNAGKPLPWWKHFWLKWAGDLPE